MRMDGNIELNLAWHTNVYARSVARRLFDKHSLQGARLPHSPQKAMFEGTVLRWKESPESVFNCGERPITKGYRSSVRRLYTEPKAHIQLLAQRTHEAAREGTVPLCEDDIWNPKDTPESPHSGLMRQPTKEEPVKDLDSGILF